MVNSEDPRQLRKPARPTLLSTARWLSHQILVKDGGLLATLRGILAAALLAVAARVAQQSLQPPARSWRLLTGAAVLVLVLAALVYLTKRGRTSSHPSPGPEAGRPGPVISAGPGPAPTVLEIHVRIQVLPGGDAGPDAEDVTGQERAPDQ